MQKSENEEHQSLVGSTPGCIVYASKSDQFLLDLIF